MKPTLNESSVEDAALTWFEEMGHAIGHEPHCAGITENLAQSAS